MFKNIYIHTHACTCVHAHTHSYSPPYGVNIPLDYAKISVRNIINSFSKIKFLVIENMNSNSW